MKSKALEKPFFEKFNKKENVFFKSKEELYLSIIDEIGNILSSRLSLSSEYNFVEYDDIPFSYGTRDIQSIDSSEEGISFFREHCQRAISRFEPRIEWVEIGKIVLNKESQKLDMEITCLVKETGEEISQDINIIL